MGIFDIFGWHGSHSNPEVRTSLTREQLAGLIFETKENIYYKQYAIQLCINKLASALSLCQFETYKKGKKNKDHYWWRLNYEPSVNTNLVDFLYQIIYEMVYNDDGALVIQSDDGQFIVAQHYNIVKNSMNGNLYIDVETYGDYKFARSFNEQDVFRFQLPNKQVRAYIDGIYKDYGKLISLTTESYIRDRSLKMVLNIGTLFDQSPVTVDNPDGTSTVIDPLDQIMETRFKNIFTSNNSITPLEEGLELNVLEGYRGSNKTEAKEVTEILDKTIDACADAFGIPRGILKGDVADVEAMTQNFITFAIRPLAKELDTEINRKLYGEQNVKNGTKLKIVTGSIQTYNIVSFAAAADKLIAATIATPNEMREVLEWESSDEPAMNQFKETKNYHQVES